MKTGLISLRILLATVLITAAAIMLVQSGWATPTPTATPRASASPVTTPASTPIYITGGFAGTPIPVTAPTKAPPSGSPGSTNTNTVSGTLSLDHQAAGGNQNLVVTGDSTFRPGQVIPGQLLCPIIAPGPKLVKGCNDTLFGAKEQSKTNKPATFRGPATESVCPDGFRSDGDFCFKPKKGGGVGVQGVFKGDGACPPDWEDTGDACKKPETKSNCAHYGRAAGLGFPFPDPRNGGECWSCPVLMHRTMHPVDSKDPSFPACTAGNDDGIFWQSAQYPEPGVVRFLDPLIVQMAFADPAYVQAFIQKRSNSSKHPGPYLWDQMINQPNDSPEFKALIFAAILLAADKNPGYTSRPGNGVAIFEDYMRKRQTYLAQDALGMYNAYLDFNAYKQWQGAKAVMLAGGPLMFAKMAETLKGFTSVIQTPQAQLSATVGVPPDDYVNAAYAAAVPDNRGEEFVKALLDLAGTEYKSASSGTSQGDPTAATQMGLNVVGSGLNIHDLLVKYAVIKGMPDKIGDKLNLGMNLGGAALDFVAAVMTLYAQEEAAKQYQKLAELSDQPVSISKILKSGTSKEKNSLIMWWGLATSAYKASPTVRELPISNADLCADYKTQCNYVKDIVTKARPSALIVRTYTPTPVPIPPAPPEFNEQVKATADLAKLLATVTTAAAAPAVKPMITAAVARVNQAGAATKNFTAAQNELVSPHKSELDMAAANVRKELTRIKGVPGAYAAIQSALAGLDPVLLRNVAGSD